MTKGEIKAIRVLIVEGAKRTFDEDYGMLLDNDDTKIKEQERLDSYIEGAEDVLEILEKSFCKE